MLSPRIRTSKKRGLKLIFKNGVLTSDKFGNINLILVWFPTISLNVNSIILFYTEPDISVYSTARFPFSSVTQSCPTLCDPMNRGTPGLPVHQLLEFNQTHVHRVGYAIRPSHPLSSPIHPSIRVFSNESTLHMRFREPILNYYKISVRIVPCSYK